MNLSSAIYSSGDGTADTPYVANSTPDPISVEINIGDYVYMGTYYDEPILWRCVDIDENGPLMLTDKIITIKPFDTNGAHPNNNDSGSNLWKTSNIRSWLNSSETEGNVNWLCGNPPTAENLLNGKNAYATEKGFLEDSNFSKSQRAAIKTVTQKSHRKANQICN